MTAKPTISSRSFHINWGWGGNHNGWFALVPSAWGPFGGSTYEENLHMLYGFTIQ
ncbi:MAG: hypothetical protein IKY63_04705 [Tidjanibacter sp.]|nr:hypothetical protein [Tidjanibacter sp.]